MNDFLEIIQGSEEEIYAYLNYIEAFQIDGRLFYTYNRRIFSVFNELTGWLYSQISAQFKITNASIIGGCVFLNIICSWKLANKKGLF